VTRIKCDVTTAPLTYIGDDERRGSYVLRITVREHLNLSFGRFKKGKLIDVRPGTYVYIGSAMAKQGATCLAKRLLRHATRSGSGAESSELTPSNELLPVLNKFER
jgi:hypothetical protein